MRQAHCTATILLLMSLSAFAGDSAPILKNAGFEDKLEGWCLQPKESAASFQELPGGNGLSLLLTADGFNSGFESLPLALDDKLDRTKTYKVSARLLSRGVFKGTFAFTVCYNNELAHRLQQHSAWSTTNAVRQTEWTTKSILIGAGTSYPFPKNAQHIVIRFSFYSKDGKPSGTIAVDDVTIETADKAQKDGWPASINLTCGNINSRIESRSFWTIYRINFMGKVLCIDRFGSHYGTVAAFKGIKGFFGSGHTENADEDVLEKHLFADGTELQSPPHNITAHNIILTKSAMLHKCLKVDNRTTITPDAIEEEATIRATETSNMSQIYHFMHPWSVSMTDYLAQLPDGTSISGQFLADGHMRINNQVAWSAVYDRTLMMGAVTIILQTPPDTDWAVIYWDQPTAYKKHYLTTFRGKTIPKDVDFKYKVKTIPFSAKVADWEKTAKSIAAANIPRN